VTSESWLATERRLRAARAGQVGRTGEDLLEVPKGGTEVEIGERQFSDDILEVGQCFRHAQLARGGVLQAHNRPGGRIHFLDYLCDSLGDPSAEIASASSGDVGHDSREGIITARPGGTEASQPVVNCVRDRLSVADEEGE